MSEENKKHDEEAYKKLKDRPDKKPDLDDYKSKDKDEIVEEKLEWVTGIAIPAIIHNPFLLPDRIFLNSCVKQK